jgi:hypothetical protein
MENSDRIKYYLGELLNNNIITQNKNIVDINTVYILTSNKIIHKIYFELLINTLKNFNFENNKFYIDYGDIEHKTEIYTLVKNRYNDYCGVILKCFNYDRHWKLFYNKPKETIFETKINKIIWRGATTGNKQKPNNRFCFVEKYYNFNENVDVGFSQIVQNQKSYEKYLKNNISVEEMLKYKYIVSIEGNDKDSGLNWKLNANAVVFMAKPKAFSWLMEDKLIPDVHYILLNENFDNLLEKYDWCEQNQDKCIEIIQNAHKYMKQFVDIKNEELIEKNVLDIYFKKINI